MTGASSADAFEVVFVCTGNQFRSPLAAAVFARQADGLPVRVSSCGTAALEGGLAFEEAAELGATLGVDLSAHRSRRLGPGELAHADLVVGFERHHVEGAVVDAGAARERTFILPELVDLLEAQEACEGAPIESARAAVAATRPGSIVEAPEILDPFGETPAVQQEIAAEVEDLSRRLALALFG